MEGDTDDRPDAVSDTIVADPAPRLSPEISASQAVSTVVTMDWGPMAVISSQDNSSINNNMVLEIDDELCLSLLQLLFYEE